MAVVNELHQSCRRLAARLLELDVGVVFAESCTAGLVAASLGRVPGISRVLCGSAVTYRDDTKARWLDVKHRTLRTDGAVSERAAREMAVGVLLRTPEAQLAGAITGHLGPDAPAGLDGGGFVAIGRRHGKQGRASVVRFNLPAGTRLSRQRRAALHVIRETFAALES